MKTLAAALVLQVFFGITSFANTNPLNIEIDLPSRSENALTGSEFFRAIEHLKGEAREKAIVDQILAGNFPQFLRTLTSVVYQKRDSGGQIQTLRTFVMPDYLAIGSNRDFVRVPLNLLSAKKIANLFGFILPTRKMVDTIYQHAQVKVAPKPMRPGPQMSSSTYYLNHNATVQQQINNKAEMLTQLVAGHKKDVVRTNKLLRKPSAIAIYGWHRLNNARPIQPLSTVHGARYADYSHGIRLVANSGVLVSESGSRTVSLDSILTSKDWQLLSDEGPLRDVSRPALSSNI